MKMVVLAVAITVAVLEVVILEAVALVVTMEAAQETLVGSEVVIRVVLAVMDLLAISAETPVVLEAAAVVAWEVALEILAVLVVALKWVVVQVVETVALEVATLAVAAASVATI